ncbi:MAG: response regulator [Fulvivirga sp.]|nr:response regulator [Fulvivirga sp.]
MAKQTIMIAHKDNDARRDIHNIISRFNFDIIYADDGIQGLETAKYKKPDLIISEVDIPMLDGIQMNLKIKEVSGMRDVPVILLHDELDLTTLSKAKSVNARAFLISPYIDNSLIYAVKRALGADQLQADTGHAPPSYESCRSKALSGFRYQYA